MVQPRNAFSALLRYVIHRGRAPLLAGAALALCLCGIAPARACMSGAAAPEDAVKVPALPAVEGSSVRRPLEAEPQPNSDEKRRVLILLLMNSSGAVRPFGGLGR